MNRPQKICSNTNIQLKGLKKIKDLFGNNNFEIIQTSTIKKQVLTHQIILGQFIKIKTGKAFRYKDYEAFALTEIERLPFPKFITAYLKDKNVSLNLF